MLTACHAHLPAVQRRAPPDAGNQRYPEAGIVAGFRFMRVGERSVSARQDLEAWGVVTYLCHAFSMRAAICSNFPRTEDPKSTTPRGNAVLTR